MYFKDYSYELNSKSANIHLVNKYYGPDICKMFGPYYS
jgi:hypothetical protein